PTLTNSPTNTATPAPSATPTLTPVPPTSTPTSTPVPSATATPTPTSGSSCPTCQGTPVVVDQNVLADFTTSPPRCLGDPDLCAFFSSDTSGPTPDTWFASFDLGARPLQVLPGATITTARVGGGNNQSAPGIRISTTCTVEVQPGGAIAVGSLNKPAGDILIRADGLVTINGTLSNSVDGTNGLPGAITVASCCGGIIAGPGSLIQTSGAGPGGSDINLLACCSEGNISLSGLVMARAKGNGNGPRPTVRPAPSAGSAPVHADTPEPQLDEFGVAGTAYDIFPGVLSWVTGSHLPGSVQIQADGDVKVFGHGNDATAPVRQSFAAVAAGSGTGDATGGLVDVRSIHGAILATHRAFQSFGRHHNAGSLVRLYAASEIDLSRPGPNSSFNPVVDSSASPSTGTGGANQIRSFSGGVFIGAGATVSATGASPGSNLL